MNTTGQPARAGSGAALGILLIALGIAFLAQQALGLELRAAGWPLFVVVPGLGLLAVGLAGPASRPFLYAGAIVSTAGAILLYQNATGHWASWAYAWALVAPGAVGVASMLEGALDGKPARVSGGLDTLAAGLGLFAVGAAFFEGVLGLGGFDFGPAGVNAFAVVLIALGAVMLVARLARPGAAPR